MPCSIWSWMPPIRLATTGRRFHIASATVSPNPSARLFWTTTSAARCSALTITAFSSKSSIGSSARWTRSRASGGSARQRAHAQRVDLRALGVVGDRRDVGAGVDQVRVGVRSDVVDEPFDHADRVLERVPARDLQDVALAGLQRPRLEHRRALDGPAGAAVQRWKTGRPSPPVRRPAATRMASDRLRREFGVLGREDVDRRRDDRAPGRVQLSQTNASREKT